MEHKSSIWYLAFAGMCTIFIGIGLARFAYTPLLPVLIQKGWLSTYQADYLGAMNFLGYLIGAITGLRITRYLSSSFVIKISMFFTVLGLAACSLNYGVIWLSSWRFVVGITGAWLMIVAPSMILNYTEEQYYGRVNGLIFTGIGLGIIISSVTIPVFSGSIVSIWLILALFTLIALLCAWPAFLKPPSIPVKKSFTNGYSNYHKPLILIGIAYTLFGVGFVFHTLFLVQYAKELGYSETTSSLLWFAFGTSAILGAFGVGWVGDKIGLYKGLVAAYLLSFIAVSIAFVSFYSFLFLSALLMGALLPGIVTLTSARISELVGTDHHVSVWGKMTLLYAVAQAMGAYFISYLLSINCSYMSCILFSAFVLFLAYFCVSSAKIKTEKLSIAQNDVV